MPITTDLSHFDSSWAQVLSLVAVTSQRQLHLLPTCSWQSVHYATIRSARIGGESESAVIAPLSQQSAVPNTLQPERSALGATSSPGQVTRDAVAVPDLQCIPSPEFSEGAREWWTRMTQGAVGDSRPVKFSSTRGKSL